MSAFERFAMEPVTLCLDGAGGAGKSTLASAIIEAAGVSSHQLIRGDWYFEPTPPGSAVSGYFNSERFMKEVGDPINRGDALTVREYDMKEDRMVNHDAPDSGQLIVVEGIKTLALPVNWWLKIWVETDRNTREQRFMGRPVEERRTNITDSEILRRNFNNWADDAELYRRKVVAEKLADLVLPGDIASTEQLESIEQELEKRIK
jgi:uridine kinase